MSKNKKPEVTKVRKILVIRLSSMGDIVVTSPVVRALSQQTSAEVHFLVKEQFQDLVAHNPYIDKVQILHKGEPLKSLARRLKEEAYDLLIDLHYNLRSVGLEKLLGLRSLRFQKLNVEKWLFVNLKWNLLPDVHIVDRYFDAIEPLGVKNDGAGLDFFIGEENQINEDKLPWSGKPYAVFAVGAAHQTKQVPLNQAIPLINHLNMPLVLVGGAGDIHRAEAIVENCCGPICDLTGQLNIQQTASIVDRSSLVLTPDTGVMHISAARRKPIVLFWGSTSREFGMSPYFGDRTVPVKQIEVTGLSCRPCTKFGKSKCPRKHFKCMLGWNPMLVAEEINDFWSRLVKSQVIPE